MIRKNPNGDQPVIDESAYVYKTAIVCGKVIVGANVFIGPYAVIRADETKERFPSSRATPTSISSLRATQKDGRAELLHPPVPGRAVAEGAFPALHSRARPRFAEELGYESTPRQMVRRWLKSPGDRGNLLDQHLEDVGVGVKRGAPKQGVPDRKFMTYTLDLGALKGK